MKCAVLFLCLMPTIFAISQQESKLSALQKEEVKQEIIASYVKHIEDLKNLDYEQVMKFYPEDHMIFGDGAYWGGYDHIDGIWKWCMNNWEVITKWQLKNHKVYVLSEDAASYLVEFDHVRVEPDGDTTKVTGCFSFGMKRFPDGWKAVTQHVTHNYEPGYDPRVRSDFNFRPMDVGIVVSDMQKSLEFYTNVIGMTEVGPWYVTPEISKSAGFTDGDAVDIINLKLNDQPGAPQYKLAKIRGVRSEKLSHSFGPGLRYLTIRVNDVEPYLKRIIDNNVKLWGESPLDFPEYDYSVLILEDPDGAMLEIAGPLRK